MENFKLTKPIRLIELFAGIGSQAKALKNIGADFEHYKVVEFDKYAIKSYNAIHGTNFETIDITNIHADDLEITDTEKYDYILTYSFPCTDISVAGKQEGMAKESGTRSGLLWEVERLLNECEELPQVLLMENVPQVHGKKNIEHFNKWIEFLESKGYSNYWQDLNAKDFRIPQNRNRCFMISIRRGGQKYNFPKPVELKLRLKDMLEDEVNEKYYLDVSKIKKIENSKFIQEKNMIKTSGNKESSNNIIRVGNTKSGGERSEIISSEGISSCLTATDYKQPKQILINDSVRIGGIFDNEKGKHQAGSIWDSNGLAPTLDTMQGGYRQPMIFASKSSSNDNIIVSANGCDIRPKDRNYKKNKTERLNQLEIRKDELSNTLLTVHQHNMVAIKNAEIIRENPLLTIRKLTPKECWRLMGFNDEDFEKAEKVNSNTQLYKQAGNSIVVNVLEAIFKQMM